MAGDWIKMRADLHSHPKVVRMASALKADKLRVVGGLHAVWCLFDMHSVDGILDGYTLSALDDHIGFAGFGVAMVSVKWLKEGEESLVTPRFDEHNGQSAKRRAQETERKRGARASALDADEKRTREEKRREEFEEVWSAYPSRPGSSKPDAFKAWNARLNAGVDAAVILAGVLRYAAYCVASETEPKYIKQPATFFGPGQHYLADWRPGTVKPRHNGNKNTAAAAGFFPAPQSNSEVIDV